MYTTRQAPQSRLEREISGFKAQRLAKFDHWGIERRRSVPTRQSLAGHPFSRRVCSPASLRLHDWCSQSRRERVGSNHQTDALRRSPAFQAGASTFSPRSRAESARIERATRLRALAFKASCLPFRLLSRVRQAGLEPALYRLKVCRLITTRPLPRVEAKRIEPWAWSVRLNCTPAAPCTHV